MRNAWVKATGWEIPPSRALYTPPVLTFIGTNTRVSKLDHPCIILPIYIIPFGQDDIGEDLLSSLPENSCGLALANLLFVRGNYASSIDGNRRTSMCAKFFNA